MPQIAKGLPSMTPEERAKYPYDFCPDCEPDFRLPKDQEPEKPGKQPKVVELRGKPRKGKAASQPQQEKKKREEKPKAGEPEGIQAGQGAIR